MSGTALQSSFFEFFGLAESFDLDASALEAAYRRVQASVHPDRFASAPQSQRRYAMQLAARANEAVRTLRDPLSRARYLCELHGVDVAAESNTAMPADFLIRQMTWRESLDEARETREGAAVEALAAELDDERDGLQQVLRASFSDPADYPRAGDAVRRWMFVERVAEDVRRARKHIREGA